jgi:hypothetical protein
MRASRSLRFDAPNRPSKAGSRYDGVEVVFKIFSKRALDASYFGLSRKLCPMWFIRRPEPCVVKLASSPKHPSNVTFQLVSFPLISLTIPSIPQVPSRSLFFRRAELMSVV